MKKLTWNEACKSLKGVNLIGNEDEARLVVAVVFTKDSFRRDFSEKERTYYVSNNNRAFQSRKISNSIFGECADGTDSGVRLDWYMHDTEHPWKVEYCYIVEDKAVLKMFGIQ